MEKELAEALNNLANAIRFGSKEIGKEGAPGMGAIEFLASKVSEGCFEVASSIRELAEAIRETN
jgi:hypothetical protein